MLGMTNVLLAEKEFLTTIIDQAIEQLKDLPPGKVRVSAREPLSQFYLTTEEDHHGTYIRRQDFELVRLLSQREYDEKALKLARQRLLQIEKLLKQYSDDEFEQIYRKMHPEKQKLINPIVTDWQKYAEQWMRIPYEAKEIREGDTALETRRGELVRSKTERTIANLLYEFGVPYKYECPLKLSNFGIVYPDFTTLSRKSRKIIIWEHYGMADDAEYANKMISKHRAYEENGYFIGGNMIITQETKRKRNCSGPI